MIFSLRKQKQDEERITLTYTRSHLVKLALAGLNLLTCFIIFIVDLVIGNLGFTIENSTYMFLWMFSIMLLRREFLKTGQTSLALIGFWGFMLITPTIVLILSVLGKADKSMLRSSLVGIKVACNLFIVLVVIVRRVDIGDIYSRTSSVYNQIMKSYFLEDESIEDEDKIWDKFDKLVDESIPLIERENIKSIVARSCEPKDTPAGWVNFYAIEISYGKTKNLTRVVFRRFREFIVFYLDLKDANPAVGLPEFPQVLQIKEQVTSIVISQRLNFFNDLFQVIMKNKLNSGLFSRFFNVKVNEVLHPNARLRTYSCIQEIPFDVSLSKAFRKSSRLVTKANYEIIISSGDFSVKTFRVFDEFKDLRKVMVKRHLEIDQLPSNYFLKSSADPAVVKERKSKLRVFIQKLIESNDSKIDKDLVKFLNLDRIYLSDRSAT